MRDLPGQCPWAGVQVRETELGWGTMPALIGRWKQLEANPVSGHEDFQEPFKLWERTDLLYGKMRKEGTETAEP